MNYISPPALHRQQKERERKFQPGIVVSYTIIHGSNVPSMIGLIQLNDGTKVLAPLLIIDDQRQAVSLIGQRVVPRMRLMDISPDGLRRYDTAYELLTNRSTPLQSKPFPGYILALTGPSGVGKSTVSRLLAGTISTLTPVPILTTRRKKETDENEYRYISKKEFSDLQTKGIIIAHAHLEDSTDTRWYGYRACDIEKIWSKGMLPVVITERHLLQGLADHFGRRSILSFGLLPPGRSKRAMLSALLHRLRQRGRDSEASLRDRIRHAECDLKFFKERRDLFDRMIIAHDAATVIETIKRTLPHFELQ